MHAWLVPNLTGPKLESPVQTEPGGRYPSRSGTSRIHLAHLSACLPLYSAVLCILSKPTSTVIPRRISLRSTRNNLPTVYLWFSTTCQSNVMLALMRFAQLSGRMQHRLPALGAAGCACLLPYTHLSAIRQDVLCLPLKGSLQLVTYFM